MGPFDPVVSPPDVPCGFELFSVGFSAPRHEFATSQSGIFSGRVDVDILFGGAAGLLGQGPGVRQSNG